MSSVGCVDLRKEACSPSGFLQQVKFGYNKSESLPTKCRECEFLQDCWGECPKNRILRTESGEPGLNYLCRGFKSYFAHAIPTVDRIVARTKKTMR